MDRGREDAIADDRDAEINVCLNVVLEDHWRVFYVRDLLHLLLAQNAGFPPVLLRGGKGFVDHLAEAHGVDELSRRLVAVGYKGARSLKSKLARQLELVGLAVG